MNSEEQVVETIKNNNIEAIRKLINEELETISPHMTSLLFFAVRFGQEEIIEFLLNNGASPKAKNSHEGVFGSVTALETAFWYSSPDYSGEIFDLFQSENKSLQNVFAKHLDKKIVKIFKLLIDHGSDYSNLEFILNIKSNSLSNTFLVWSQKMSLIRTFKICVYSYVDKNHNLLNAIIEGDVLGEVQGLLNQGVNPNIRDKDGFSALHLAVKGDNINIVELLLDNDAEPNIRSWKNLTTPLHNAVLGDKTDIVESLLKHGADSNVLSKHGTSPLYFSIVNNNEEISCLLVKYGAKSDALLKQLSTLLDCVVTQKGEKAEEILCKVERLGKFLHEKGTNIIHQFNEAMKKASMNSHNEVAKKMSDIVSKITFPSQLESLSIEKPQRLHDNVNHY